jgi:hypothetical protein
LSETEFKAHHDARRAERKAAREAEGKTTDSSDTPREGRRGRRGDPFKHADWNLDGSLSLDEFSARPRMMAARIDRNGDGTITSEEREFRRHGPRDGDKTEDKAPTQQDQD